jgi:mevalonate kinase
VTASAPGKIILTGEHYVVHGSTAIAAAINLRARVTVSLQNEHESRIISRDSVSPALKNDGRFPVVKSVIRKIFEHYGRLGKDFDVKIDSDIPLGSGLGSSAAVSVATSAAFARLKGKSLSKEEIWEIAHQGEKTVHGNPSGIDTWTSLRGGIIMFRKSKRCRSIEVKNPIEFLVVFSGNSRNTTRLVSKVNDMKKRYPFTFSHYARAATQLSLDLSEALVKGDLNRLGALMDLTQLSLNWAGASTKRLDSIIETLRTKSLGAKITGAGGGGSVIALPKPGKAEAGLRIISRDYPISFISKIPQVGLIWGQ